MLFSFEWLRALCPVDDDPSAAGRLLTARGLTVDAITSTEHDTVLDVDVPANRPDCLGHLGVARELSAATGVALASAPEPPATDGDPVGSSARVAIDAPDLCRRFTASLVREVRIEASPDWVVKRLEACGLRSINNVVDASNLVMLETGNPVHFYDLERVGGQMLSARRAAAGERLTTLDGVERTLDDRTLLIVDGDRASGIAGIMGGADSEIHESTRHVLIEAAWFAPESIRRSANRLGLKTDASFRFERGVDPEGVVTAQRLAVRLLVDLARGKPAPEMIDVRPEPPEAKRLVLRTAQLPRLLGYDPGFEATRAALESLALRPTPLDRDRIEVSVPSWRVDLDREVDLIEEVARHLGYDRIPVTTMGLPSRLGSSDEADLENRTRDLLVARGFHEAFGYAMIGPGEDVPFVEPTVAPPLRLSNPISETQAELRRSLLPGLLRATDLNLRRGVRDIRLFEVGPVFLPASGKASPDEPARIGIVWTGNAGPRHWSEATRTVALFDLLGTVELLLLALRPAAAATRRSCQPPGAHPAHAACWEAPDGTRLAWAGLLHPDIRPDSETEVWVAEIDLDAVSRLPASIPQFAPIPRLTEITRDLAAVVRPGLDYASIVESVACVEPPAPVSFEAVDRYEGPPLAEGESSLTIRVTLRPDERPLTEDEIEGYRSALVERLKLDLGVGIRGD